MMLPSKSLEPRHCPSPIDNVGQLHRGMATAMTFRPSSLYQAQEVSLSIPPVVDKVRDFR